MKSQNPISVRSREMIRGAVFELLNQKPYEEITVSDIALEAGIARKTFYRNYGAKDEVVVDYLREIDDMFLEALESSRIEGCYDFGLVIFRFWEPHAGKIQFFYRKGIFGFFRKEYERLLPQVSMYFPYDDNRDDVYEGYCEAFVKGGFWQILSEWIIRGAKETPEAMAGYFSRIRRGF